MSKPVERAEARRLRQEEGESVRTIARRLGVSVSSVSAWVRDVPLSGEQAAALRARDPRYDGRARGAASTAARARAARERWQAEGRARAEAGDDPLFLTGCMLHWAEGAKRRNAVVFSNSDVEMMRLFARFLRECFEASDEQLAFSVNCFLGNGLELDEIERFWLDALALPPSCLRAATVNRPSAASRRKGRVLLHGTGRLVLHSTAAAQTIYGAVQAYGGFERPEWLD